MILNNKNQGPLRNHLQELRERLIKSLFSLLPAFLVCWFFSHTLLDFLRRPIQPFLKNTNGGLIFTAPMDPFIAHLQVSLFSAVILASPFWLSQLWLFISPGLYKKEKSLFLSFCLMGAFLFAIGLCFAYYVVFPIMFSVLMNFGSSMDQAFITIRNYLSFITRSALTFGLMFEMPLVLLLLCRSGVLSPQVLKKYRRHAFLLLAVLSAFITPPDVMSMLLLLLPLVGLYEFSLQLILFMEKKA